MQALLDSMCAISEAASEHVNQLREQLDLGQEESRHLRQLKRDQSDKRQKERGKQAATRTTRDEREADTRVVRVTS